MAKVPTVLEAMEDMATELPSVITSSDVQALHYILECAWSSCKVAIAVNDSGAIIYGTARNLTNGGEDIRTQALRVTSKTGFEHFFPVMKLVELYREGGFAKYDW